MTKCLHLQIEIEIVHKGIAFDKICSFNTNTITEPSLPSNSNDENQITGMTDLHKITFTSAESCQERCWTRATEDVANNRNGDGFGLSEKFYKFQHLMFIAFI